MRSDVQVRGFSRGHFVAERLWRLGTRLKGAQVPYGGMAVSWLLRFLFSAELPAWDRYPEGLHLLHNAQGVVMHPDTTFEGSGVYLFHRVTLGNSWGKNEGTPTLHSDIVVGAGAALLGSITVGNNVLIGANAVVTKDVPDNTLCLGTPAQFRELPEGYVAQLVREHETSW